MNSFYQNLLKRKERGVKSFAVLLDPDKMTKESTLRIVNIGIESKIDFFFVGGSLLTNNNHSLVVKMVKANTNIPVILFPGGVMQVSKTADGILLLSLISGRNPEFLIGQHVIAAPMLKKSGLEIIPTGYMLINCGNQTSVAYISNTMPIPHDKPTIAACTAMAGEMLGLKLLYMDGGSGAVKPVSKKMIAAVKGAADLPLIVGGGLDTPQKAFNALSAGADLVVVGNGIEKRPGLLIEMAEMVNGLNVH
jgi:phosphoglycerol geranylgeranyltransferase